MHLPASRNVHIAAMPRHTEMYVRMALSKLLALDPETYFDLALLALLTSLV